MAFQSKPNFTAWVVMQGTIAALRQPMFRESADNVILELYEPLAKEASKSRLISRIICALPYNWQYRIGGLVTHPDRLSHFCFRKKEIEKWQRKLLDAGEVQQVVALGAGLDVTSLRLAKEYPAVKFIEIDTEESQHFKISSFRMHDVTLPANMEFMAGDLRDPLSQILNHSDLYQANAKTLWIAEGFFMFIPRESVIKILGEVRELSASGSYVIFTSLPSYKPNSWLRYLLQTFFLHKEDSAYRWIIEFEEVPAFIKSIGYQTVCEIDYDSLHRSYQPKKPDNNRDVVENIHIVKTC